MITVNSLEVTKDGLFIDVSIKEHDSLVHKYLNTITIKGYLGKTTYPSKTISCNNVKEFSIYIPKNTLTIDDRAIYEIYITTSGTAGADVPCGLYDSKTILTVDKCFITNKVLPYIKGIVDTCNVSKDFVNIILFYNAFIASAENNDLNTALNYWNKLLEYDNKTTNKCRCNNT